MILFVATYMPGHGLNIFIHGFRSIDRIPYYMRYEELIRDQESLIDRLRNYPSYRSHLTWPDRLIVATAWIISTILQVW